MLHVNNPKVTVEYSLPKFANIWFRVEFSRVDPGRPHELRTAPHIFRKIPGQSHPEIRAMGLSQVRHHVYFTESPKLTTLVNAIRNLRRKKNGK